MPTHNKDEREKEEKKAERERESERERDRPLYIVPFPATRHYDLTLCMAHSAAGLQMTHGW